jgi:hypothetical protein
MHGPINVKSPNNISKWQMGFNSAFKGLTQENFSDVVRGLNLSEKQAKLLGSRPKGCNLLYKDNEMCCIRYTQNEFKEFFSPGNNLLFFNDVCKVMDALGHQHDPNEWRLFTEY